MATSAHANAPTEGANAHARLAELIQTKQARIGVIGLGYVGLPLIRAFTAAGFRCLGFDVDQAKVDKLKAGHSYIKHIDSSAIAELIADNSSSRRPTWAAWPRPTASSSACRRR